MTSPRVAIGPELPEFGSWNWIGKDLVEGLSDVWDVETFSDLQQPPEADITVFLKFKPTVERLGDLNNRTRLVFLPVDVYESAEQITVDRPSLVLFDLILVHSQRLVRYFNTAATTQYIDHALRFVTARPVVPNSDGPLLWVGRCCNISPVVDWCNRHELNRSVLVLTNESPHEFPPELCGTGRQTSVHGKDISSESAKRRSARLGFNTLNDVTVREWSPTEHVSALETAFAALDVKGTDFRARHKPPAKVLDFLASGIPVVVNRGGSADLHLSTLGFQPACCENGLPEDPGTTAVGLQAFAQTLRNNLSKDKVAGRIEHLFRHLLRAPKKKHRVG